MRIGNTTHATRVDLLTSATPADPFSPISAAITYQFTRPLSKTTIALLATFLVFHALIALFSLVILLLPYVGQKKRSHWIFRTAFIPNRPGEPVCKTPLYLINTGFFMCIVQLLGSLSTISFICLQINPSRLLDYQVMIIGCPFFSLGLMYLFEHLAYWIMAHCFLALSYSACETSGWTSKGLINWAPPPVLVNVIFSCLPICFIVAITAAIARAAIGYGIILEQTRKTLDFLSQGTSVWNQLQDSSRSAEQKALLVSHLARIQGELKSSTKESVTNLNSTMRYHHKTQILYLVCICVTCLVFILSFWKLTQKLVLQGQNSVFHPNGSAQLDSLHKYPTSQKEAKAPFGTTGRIYLGALLLPTFYIDPFAESAII
ncbi:hypothetical protein PtB15_9B19 [Puccinia triticina]|nr:hypothetical protein PtB15_9B19 [Puccinia triticina]